MMDYEWLKEQLIGNVIRALVTIPWIIFLTGLSIKIGIENILDSK